MTGIYIASSCPRSGKSLLSFSLGVLLQKRGISLGYMKPLGRLPQKKDELLGDADALVVQEILGQTAPADELTPVMVPQNFHELSMLSARSNEEKAQALQRVRTAYSALGAGKDLMLVSGTADFPAAGRFAGMDGFTLVRELGLKVLLIERYADMAHYDTVLMQRDALGDSLLGLVLNDVPEQERHTAETWFKPWLEGQGIPVFGILDHEEGLLSMRVVDVAHALGGRIVAGNASASGMVAGFLIGTMQVDNFMMHLRGKDSCAVIVGGDRADLQLAALHAKAPCLVLTGNIPPCDLVREKAERMGVALVAVREDTYSIARSMSRILQAKKLHDLGQIRLAVSLVERSLDISRILDKVNILQ